MCISTSEIFLFIVYVFLLCISWLLVICYHICTNYAILWTLYIMLSYFVRPIVRSYAKSTLSPPPS
jgi:hypothetical protein